MLTKYPEIWLRESVMLVDLQTSSICCQPPPSFLQAFLLWPCVTQLQKAHSTKERRRPETLKPITIDQSVLRRRKTKLTCTHMQMCLDKESPVSEGATPKLICNSASCQWQHCETFLTIFHHPQKSWSQRLPITFSLLLVQEIQYSNIYSSAVNHRSSVFFKEHVSYSAAGKNIILYIIIVKDG